MITILVVMFLVGVYFVPTIIAQNNRSRNEGAIFALNLLTGWTGIGWVVALVWALCKEKRRS